MTVDYSITVNYKETVTTTYHGDKNLNGTTSTGVNGTTSYGNATWNGEEWEGTATTVVTKQAVYTGKSVGRTDYAIDPDIQYNVTIYADDALSSNGSKTASSGDDSYFSNWKYTVSYPVESDPHVTLPTITADDKKLNQSLEYDSKPSSAEIKQYAVDQINARFADRTLAVKNDNLSLNGRTYMTDDSISFGFTNGMQMSVGVEANDYVNYQTHPEAEKTVNIPEDKANGTYYTTLDADYKYMGALNGCRYVLQCNLGRNRPYSE